MPKLLLASLDPDKDIRRAVARNYESNYVISNNEDSMSQIINIGLLNSIRTNARD